MGAKKENKPRERVFHGFLNYYLTEGESLELKKQTWTADGAWLFLAQLVEDGYRVSFHYDDYNECTQVSMLPVDEKHKFAGWTLTARGSDVAKALKQLRYIHQDVLDGDWKELIGNQRPRIVIDD